MPRRLIPVALFAVLVLALAVVAPVTRASVVVGMGDQKASVFSDARLTGLGLRYARLIVPWDAASTEPATVDAWLAAVAAAGMTPHIAFEHLRSDACPSSRRCVVPTAAQYGVAVRRFIARWPQIKTYTTWNEANHTSQPVASRPELVAAYYDQLVAACLGCTIVAGDVLDSGSYANWLRRFLSAASTTPQLWGLHDYGDVTYGRTTGVDTVLSIVPGTLWIEETGGIVTLRNDAGRATFSATESAAATAIDRAFAIAATRPRITRMYIYSWQAKANDSFDAGLVRPDGTTRPSLTALQRNLAGAAAAKTTTAAAKTPVTWKATWSKQHKRQVVLTATCRTTVVRCTGMVTATLRTRAAGVAQATFARVASKKAYATTSKKRVVSVRITLTSRAFARASRAPTRRVVLTVAATRPSKATSKVTVTLARP
ncbi:glycosyl hydrolase [Baekduia sp. Peel2402]|uniref:glycosyl hydrolase n=1 Tax=Baekduia sp. Peel2402 TaxID=3458296 RepID=UPI00403E9828